MNIKLALLVLIIGFTSCSNRKKSSFVMGKFDLSLDDKYIIFSAFSNGIGSIYQTDINGNNVSVMINGTQSESLWNPCFSMDGKEVVFIGRNENGSGLMSIYITNSDFNKVGKLIDGYNITQAFFSRYSNSVIFLQSNQNKPPSSSKTEAGPSGTDIYSINIETKEIKQLSNLNAYALFQVSEIDSSTFLMFTPTQYDDESGMKYYSKDSAKVVETFLPVNNPRKFPSMYSSPLYSKKYNELVFIAPYELYAMDKDKKIAHIVYSNIETGKSANEMGIIESFCFFKTQNRVLFYEEGDDALYAINSDRTNFKKISIKLPKQSSKE